MRAAGLLGYPGRLVYYIPATILLFSCQTHRQDPIDEMPRLYSDPLTVAVNTAEGYKINPVTGDTILPIISFYGDTIKSGVPVPAIGKVIDPDSVGKSRVIPAGKPRVVPAHQNVNLLQETLAVIPVNRDSLKTFTPVIDSSIYMFNKSAIDTVPTGVPIQLKGKTLPCKQPRSIKALPPHMKDNACRNIKYLEKDQGMNSNSVNAILEDSHGYLWFGTRNGASRYDGTSFKHFTADEGLCNYVTYIHEDCQGNLWFATYGSGIIMYNGETFTHYTEEEGFYHNDVRTILEDSHGNLWFGMFEGGVSKYNGETFTHFTEKEGLASNIVTSIIEDSNKNLWIGTFLGICKYDGTSFTHITENEGLVSSITYSTLEDRYGNLWFATGGGISMYDGNVLTDLSEITEREDLNYNTVTSILEDGNGNIWFGTLGGGVSLFNGKYYTQITTNEGLTNNYITSILEDSFGNLWIGTSGGGVNLYNVKSFSPYTDIKEINNSTITSIIEDSNGSLWFGTKDGGVFSYDGKTYMHLTEKEGLRYNGIYTILEDSKNNLWFSYRWNRGVNMYDGKTFTHFPGVDILSGHILSMLEDDQGNIWFGRYGEIVQYNGKTFIAYTEEGSLRNTVVSLLQDSNGNLWFGTYGEGVGLFDGKYITHITEKEGLINNNVLSMLEDNFGNLWFGTEGGVSIYNGETFIQFTEKEGLSSNVILSMLEDNNNNIWISTESGLNYLSFNGESVSKMESSSSDFNIEKDGDKMKFNSPVIYSYNKGDGLRGIEFHCATLDKKNRIWWGSDKGLAMLDMNEFTPPENPPIFHFNQIDINEQYADYRNLEENAGIDIKFDSVARFNNYPLNLKLPKKLNHLTFYFSAIDWSAPHKIRYSFKMKGLDKKWSQPASESRAEYRNLPHGTFTFTVRAIGAAQKWSEPFEYTFTISPPFWLSWWAFVVYSFILVLLIRWYRGFLIKREKVSADLRIKEVEIEKMQELDQMKSRFFANISHEFRTPLTLIHGPIEDLRKQFKGSMKGSKEIFQTVLRNTRRLQELINQLLDISKLETGNIKLQLTRDDLAVYVKTVILSFLSLAEHKKIRYEYDLPGEDKMIWFDHDKIEKIVTNLISNAFKYTDTGGKVSVHMHYIDSKPDAAAGSVEIRVSDTGKGIPAGKQEKIFDRFYQVSDPEGGVVEGTGLGLALTRELVELYRGEIRVESEEGKGSVFTVYLPVSESQFREEEFEEHTESETMQLEPEAVAGVESHVPDPGIGKPEVLIVEDNIDLMNYISRNLESEYAVLSAEDGKAGLERAREKIPDLVVSDVMMPVMDGIEMCRLLKTDDRTDHIPVIMLTAKADMPSKLEGLETGADDYMVKPFDTEELKVRVKNLLDQRRRLREKFRKEYSLVTTDIESPPQDQFLKKLFEIFDQNISNTDYRLDQLSGELNLSRSQVQRKVMALTNYTPVELFRNHRLKRAAVYFRSGHTHVAQVMHRVGFNNQSYFTKCFGELYDMTPSQFITSTAR